METTIPNMLVLVAFGLLVIVTGGSVYLTMTDWRDRRRRDEEARSQKAPRKK